MARHVVILLGRYKSSSHSILQCANSVGISINTIFRWSHLCGLKSRLDVLCHWQSQKTVGLCNPTFKLCNQWSGATVLVQIINNVNAVEDEPRSTPVRWEVDSQVQLTVLADIGIDLRVVTSVVGNGQLSVRAVRSVGSSMTAIPVFHIDSLAVSIQVAATVGITLTT